MKNRYSAIPKLLMVVMSLWVWAALQAESFRGSGPLLYQSEGDVGVSAYLTISADTVIGEIPATIEYEIKNLW